MGFGYCSCIYKEGQPVKVYTFGLVVLSSFNEQQGVLKPCRLHTWFSLGHFKPSPRRSHTFTLYIYAVLSLSVSFFCRCLCLCFLLSLSLSFFLPLFSVQLVNPSSLYRTTSFDTHSKSLSVNCTDRMRPSFPKSCVSVRVYARLSWVNVALLTFA